MCEAKTAFSLGLPRQPTQLHTHTNNSSLCLFVTPPFSQQRQPPAQDKVIRVRVDLASLGAGVVVNPTIKSSAMHDKHYQMLQQQVRASARDLNLSRRNARNSECVLRLTSTHKHAN